MSTRCIRPLVWLFCLLGFSAVNGCGRGSEEKIHADKVIAKVDALGGTATREPDQPSGPVRDIDLSEKKVGDKELAELMETRSLGSLRSLDLSKTQITGAGLAHLKGLNSLEILDLGNTKINDPDLEQLTSLPKLQSLGLNGTQITDAGLDYLKALPHLETLDLSHTAIDDAGLQRLKTLKNLATLQVSDTKVTDAGVEALKKDLPDCSIDRSTNVDQ